jgi:serine/threonine protein kinase
MVYNIGILIFEMLTGRTPFDHSNRKKVQYAICHVPVKLPRWISKHAASLLSGLLTKDPARRLGTRSIDDIKSHPFFASIDWEQLVKKEVKPPFIPSTVVSHHTDTSRFDRQFTDEKVVDSPADTSRYLLDSSTFAGFSYTRAFTPHDYQ